MSSPAFPKLRGTDPQASRTQDSIAQQLTPIANALAATPIMGAPPPAWLPMALVGGFAATGAPQAAPEYHKDALGYVHVKAAIVTAAGSANDTTFTTFPAGYRPSESLHFAIKGNGGTVQFVSLTSAGVAQIEIAVAAGGFTDMYFSFLAEQ